MPDRKSSSETALPAVDHLKASVDMIGKAAEVIDDLVRYNQNLQSVAAKGVTDYRSRLQEEIKHRQKLDNEIGNLVQEKAQLQRQVADLKKQLGEKDVELETLRDLLWPQRK